MKSLFFLLVGFFVCAGVQAQQHSRQQLRFITDKEGKLMAVPVLREPMEIEIPEIAYNSYQPTNHLVDQMELELKEFRIPTLPDWRYRPMDMNVLSDAYKPFFNEYTAMLRRVSPMALDFDEYALYPVGVNGALAVNGRQFTWPGAGGVTTAQASLVWGSDRWTITGGAFAGRYYNPYATAPGFLGGVNVTAKYQLNDQMAVRGWGQYTYSNHQGQDVFLQMNPLLNQTNLGGAVEFKVTDDFNFGIGVNYQKNHFNGRFEPQYMVYPVGRDRMKIGVGW